MTTIVFDKDKQRSQNKRLKGESFLHKIAMDMLGDSAIRKDFPSKTFIHSYDSDIDIEDLNLEESFDIIMSNCKLQFANNVQLAINNYIRGLNPNGFLGLSLIGGESFYQLRESYAAIDDRVYQGIFPRVMPMITLQSAFNLFLYSKLREVVAHSEKILCSYGSLKEMLFELKSIGFGNFLSLSEANLMSKHFIDEVEKYYFEKFSSNRKLLLTFEIIVVCGFWRE